MNKLVKSLSILFLAFLIGSCFSIDFVQAQNNNLTLEVTKECDIQYAGDICVAELKLTNNAGEILDGTVELHIDYQGVCSNNELSNFDGEGVEAQFYNNDNWLNFSEWKDGTTIVSDFNIDKSETQPKLKIETALNLCPGNYTFTLTLKGTAETGETHTAGTIIGGGGGGSYYGLEIYNEKASGIDPYIVTITWITNKDATSRVIYSSELEPHLLQLNNPPDYGYAHSTAEDSTKVQSHSVSISGLEPGLTYFYRCVSHTSPEETISTEHSFTASLIEETEEGEE